MCNLPKRIVDSNIIVLIVDSSAAYDLSHAVLGLLFIKVAVR